MPVTMLSSEDPAMIKYSVVFRETMRPTVAAMFSSARTVKIQFGPATVMMAQPDEIAEMAIAIMANDYVNGTIVNIDGAFTY
jgi:hypothetical protein